MGIRQIRLETDDILRKRSKEIDFIDDKIKELADDMIDTLYQYDGIGLSAVQVGMLKRMIVYDVEYIKENGNKKPIIVINPVITRKSKQMITTEEGCLSYPNIFGCVDRHQKITLEGLDIDGRKLKVEATDVEAVVIQHECDHLDGIIFLDKAYDVYRYDPNKVEEPSKTKKGKKNKNKKRYIE